MISVYFVLKDKDKTTLRGQSRNLVYQESPSGPTLSPVILYSQHCHTTADRVIPVSIDVTTHT